MMEDVEIYWRRCYNKRHEGHRRILELVAPAVL